MLEKERARTTRSTWLTTLVGLALLGLLGFYFWYGYQRFREVTEPEKLVDVAQLMLDEQLPEARRSLEAEIAKNAPVWAQTLSEQAVGSMPMAREQLREYILKGIEKQEERLLTITTEQFRGALQKNHDELAKLFRELQTNPTLAEGQLETLEKMLEAEFASDMKAESALLLETLQVLNKELARFREGKDLTEDEQVMRRALLLARTLVTESGGASASTNLVPLYPQTVKPLPTEAVKARVSEKLQERALDPEAVKQAAEEKERTKSAEEAVKTGEPKGEGELEKRTVEPVEEGKVKDESEKKREGGRPREKPEKFEKVDPEVKGVPEEVKKGVGGGGATIAAR
jgi:hypothetical protein